MYLESTKMEKLFLIVFISLILSFCKGNQIPFCSRDVCKLPKCFCSGTDIPGQLSKNDVPQIVMVTFQGAVTQKLVSTYFNTLLGGRVNPNQCPCATTFFVQNEYTNYDLVRQLYSMKQEIAIFGGISSESEPTTFNKWLTQVEGQMSNLHINTGIPLENLNGYRSFGNWAPGGDVQYTALQTAKLSYDSSLRCANLKYWPYTFDYQTTQGCPVPVCPTNSHKGFWEVPITYYYDKNNVPCAFMDGCRGIYSESDAFNLLVNNFFRHYNSNRSPFPMYFHDTWLERYNYTLPAVLKFLDVISKMQDVYFVSLNQTIEWVKNPTKLSAINKFKPWSC